MVQESSLWWRQKADFRWELKAQRRGVYPIGPPRITVADLLGFFPKEREQAPLQIIVYPRIIPLVPFSVPRRDFFGVPGKKSPVKDPIYILGTRDYQHWQPAKYIHWKASARHSRLQEKVFDPSEQEKVLLVLDVTPFSRSEEAAGLRKGPGDHRLFGSRVGPQGVCHRLGDERQDDARGKCPCPYRQESPAARNGPRGPGQAPHGAGARSHGNAGEGYLLALGDKLYLLFPGGRRDGLGYRGTSLPAAASPRVFVVSRPPSPASAHRERFRSTIYNSEQLTVGAPP